MNSFMRLVSLIALGTVVVPCVLYFLGIMRLDVVKLLAILGTIAWFTATPIWMTGGLPVDAAEVEI